MSAALAWPQSWWCLWGCRPSLTSAASCQSSPAMQQEWQLLDPRPQTRRRGALPDAGVPSHTQSCPTMRWLPSVQSAHAERLCKLTSKGRSRPTPQMIHARRCPACEYAAQQAQHAEEDQPLAPLPTISLKLPGSPFMLSRVGALTSACAPWDAGDLPGADEAAARHMVPGTCTCALQGPAASACSEHALLVQTQRICRRTPSGCRPGPASPRLARLHVAWPGSSPTSGPARLHRAKCPGQSLLHLR